MSRLKYLITTCALALTVSFGLSVACPSYSKAVPLSFDYSGTDGGLGATGSFTIDSSVFNNNDRYQFVSNSSITAFSFTIDTLQGVSMFGLGNVGPGSIYFDTCGSVCGWPIDYPRVLSGSGFAVGSDVLSFSADNGSDPAPIILLANGTPFNYAGTWTVVEGPLSSTPLPAALPLFAGGLGVIGLLARRRKRKAAAAVAAA